MFNELVFEGLIDMALLLELLVPGLELNLSESVQNSLFSVMVKGYRFAIYTQFGITGVTLLHHQPRRVIRSGYKSPLPAGRLFI